MMPTACMNVELRTVPAAAANAQGGVIAVAGARRQDEACDEWSEDVSSRFSMHGPEQDVEMLPVMAMAAQVHRRHSAASARWDEGNLMRAMERLGVGTLGWRYGSGA